MQYNNLFNLMKSLEQKVGITVSSFRDKESIVHIFFFYNIFMTIIQ